MVSASRILILSQFYYPELTGSAPVVTTVAEWLAHAGHDVTVVTTRPHYPAMVVPASYASGNLDRETINGVSVHRVPPLLGTGGGFRHRIKAELSYMIRMWRRVTRIAEGNPDVVISLCPSMLTVLGAAMGPAKDRRHVVLLHDIQSGLAASLRIGHTKLIANAMRRVERLALNRADVIIALSTSMKSILRDMGVVTKVAVLPPQVDIEKLDPIPEKEEWSKTVLYSGNLGRKQGMEQVLDMAAELLILRPDVQVIIRGDGNQRAQLESAVKDRGLHNVSFDNLLPPGLLAEAFGSCAVHLVPQRPEAGDYAVPSKLYTIMAASRPAVCTAAAGSALHRLMEESGAMVCVPPNRPRHFALAILELIDDKNRRRQLGNAGRAYVEQHLARTAVVAKLESLLVGPNRVPYAPITATADSA